MIEAISVGNSCEELSALTTQCGTACVITYSIAATLAILAEVLSVLTTWGTVCFIAYSVIAALAIPVDVWSAFTTQCGTAYLLHIVSPWRWQFLPRC